MDVVVVLVGVPHLGRVVRPALALLGLRLRLLARELDRLVPRVARRNDLERRALLQPGSLPDQLEQALLAGLTLTFRGGVLGRVAAEILALGAHDAVLRRH